MSLRINHNLASIDGHRNLQKNDAAVSKSLERLSSGMKINRAADDAAGLVISEQMRSQLAGLQQALSNSETAVAMVQTSEGSLDEINNLLNKMRQLTLHAANAGTNDVTQLTADQKELDNAIDSINRIATQTQFGTKKLLDGSLAAANNYDSTKILRFDVGSALLARGDFTPGAVSLQITTAGTCTVLSFSAATLAQQLCFTAAMATEASYLNPNGNLSATMFTAAGGILSTVGSAFSAATNRLAEGAAVTITVAGQDYRFESGESVGDIVSYINDAQDDYDLDVAAGSLRATRTHLGVGGTATDLSVRFSSGVKNDPQQHAVASATASVTAAGNKEQTGAQTVSQIAGVLLGGAAVNIALVADTTDASVLRATSYGIVIDTTNAFAGQTTTSVTLQLTRGALFQVGPNASQQTAVDIKSAKASDLGLGGDPRTSNRVDNLQSIKTSQSLVNGDFKGALAVIDQAINDVTNLRGQLGAFQANTLDTGLSSLAVAKQNLTQAESTIRDVDFALESAQFTRNQILVQASTSMLAQANQLPQNVLKLLG
jgi:flagellin